MNTRRLATTLLTAATCTWALAGCQSDASDPSRDDARAQAPEHAHDDHGDGTTEVEVKMADVPAKVRAGFEKQYAGAKVHKIEKETYRNGTVHYEFEFEHAGKRMEAEFDTDGELLPEH